MFSGENELPMMMDSVQKQTGVEITHHVVSGKRELEAHAELYGKWNDVKHDFDAFVQVDPDTVITSPDSFLIGYQLLLDKVSEGYTSLQCPLFDFFSMANIYGLNMYHTSVIFNRPTDEIFCDRSTSNNVTIPFKKLPASLNPVGHHCPNPHFKQSFHFGLHRGLKNRTQQRREVINAFRTTGDDRRAMAALGFEMSADFVAHKKTSYSDKEFDEAYVAACSRFKEFKERLRE
jgi:hypothetical protein